MTLVELDLDKHEDKLLTLVVIEPLPVQDDSFGVQGAHELAYHPRPMDRGWFVVHALEDGWRLVLGVFADCDRVLSFFEDAHGLFESLDPVVSAQGVDD